MTEERSRMKYVAGFIVAAVVVAGVVVGGYLGGWWLREDVVDRTAEIRERTFARQTALQEEVLDLHKDVTHIDVQIAQATEDQAPALKAHRVALVDRLCDAYERMTSTVQIPASVESFVRGEC